MTSSVRYVVGGVAIVIVALAVAAGLMVVGSPTAERLRRLDERRVGDLVQITRAIDSYWKKNAVLPASLDVLRESPTGSVTIVDPETKQAYGYEAHAGKSYELCADFQHELTEDDSDSRGRFWLHGVGRKCFQLEAETNRP